MRLFGDDQRLADEVGQPRARVLAVALLRAEALGADDEHALVRDAPPGEPHQPVAHGERQAAGMAHVETQLDRGRDLVDVLPARPRGADEALLEVALVDRDARR